MQQSFWFLNDADINLKIHRISNVFKENSISKEGNDQKGQISFKSYYDLDQIWGPYAKVEIYWETVDAKSYHHGITIKESIDSYASIGVIATNKDNSWHLSHERTIWYGTQQKLKQRRMYSSKIIHAVFYCDRTSRLFNVHINIIKQVYQDFAKESLEFIDTIHCHAV